MRVGRLMNLVDAGSEIPPEVMLVPDVFAQEELMEWWNVGGHERGNGPCISETKRMIQTRCQRPNHISF